MTREDRALARAHRAVAVLLGVTLSLGAALAGLLGTRAPERAELIEAALSDPTVRRAAIDELLGNAGLYDAHPDPDVGRVLQANVVDHDLQGTLVSTNRFGWREVQCSWRKRAGTTRVILLGDSFVFGWGVRREDRLGVFLADYLRARARASGPIECLHLGIPSWNVLAECSYLRRNLHDLQPDLVVHVLVPNDLNDMAGVRGFGALGRFSRQSPEKADALVHNTSPPEWW